MGGDRRLALDTGGPQLQQEVLIHHAARGPCELVGVVVHVLELGAQRCWGVWILGDDAVVRQPDPGTLAPHAHLHIV
eukprot:9486034-Pyramimonas_sp.AAC.2